MNKSAICEGAPLDPTRYASSIGAYLQEIVSECPDGKLISVPLEGSIERVPYRFLWELALAVLSDLRIRWPNPVPIQPVADTLADRVSISWACLIGGYPLVVAPPGWSESELPPNTQVYFSDLSRTGRNPASKTSALIGDTPWSDVENTAEDPDQILAYILTSGTTGQSRFACFSAQALLYQYCAKSPLRAATVDKKGYLNTPDDVHLSMFPWYSVSGMRRALFPRAFRQIFLEPDVLLARPVQLLELLEKEQVTGLSLSTSFAAVLLDLLQSHKKTWNLSALKRIGLGAEAIIPEVFRDLTQILSDQCGATPQVMPGYGMTETSVLCSVPDDPEFISSWMTDDSLVSVGKPVEGWNIRIVDDNDQLLSAGDEGHLQVYSPKKGFSGYLDETADQSGPHTEDGWFRTGDTGWICDGWVWVSGRSKETLIINGAKYPPESIERSLTDVPGVLQGQVYACRVRAKNALTDGLGIFFVPDPAHPSETTKHSLRARIARIWKLSVDHIQSITAAELPRTSTGKLKRNALGASVKDLDRTAGEYPGFIAARTPAEQALAAIWQEVLMLGAPPGIHDDFFALGGHSLLSARMISRVDKEFGWLVPLHSFFEMPTIAALAALLPAQQSHADPTQKAQSEPEQSQAPESDEAGVTAPRRYLEPHLYRELVSYNASWRGERAHTESLIVGQNLSGTRPPLFWVLQGELEMVRLASALGSDQPFYGLRSGHLVMKYSEDNIQAMALDYVREIEELHPGGPIIIGGNCQGGMIALAIAQHLLRRRYHVPLLILMEWSFKAQPYAGPVGLIFGRESEDANPYWYFRHPEQMWQRSWPQHHVEMIPGAHGQFFTPLNVKGLATAVRSLIDSALNLPLRFLPGNGLSADLIVNDPPQQLAPGETKRLKVRVTNTSSIDWPENKTLGLTLVNQWLDTDAEETIIRMDGATPLPSLRSGSSAEIALDVQAPEQPAAYQLAVRVVEEGVRHRKTDQSVVYLPIRVEGA